MLEMCGLIDDPESPKAGKHRVTKKGEIEKSEKAVQRTMADAIQNFMNRFEVSDKDHLYNISSGAPVTAEIEQHVLRAEKIGRESKEAFSQERFLNNSSRTHFFKPIKKLKLKTMEATNKKISVLGSHGKVSVFSRLTVYHVFSVL